MDYGNSNFELNNEAHDDNNSHLNNTHSCLSECDYYTQGRIQVLRNGGSNIFDVAK